MRLKLKCFWDIAKYLSLNIEIISPNEHSVFLLDSIIAFHSISISKVNSSSLFTQGNNKSSYIVCYCMK